MSQPESELPFAEPVVTSLQDRIERLEAAVTALQHTDAKVNSTPTVAAIPVAVPRAPLRPRLLRVRWLLVDICREALAIVRMFLDIRYHVAWSTRILTVVLFIVIITSQLWLPIPGLLGVGPVLDKMFDLVLAFIMYKVLSREAARYMETRISS